MDYTELSLEQSLKWLKDNLDEKRYQHSLGTAECAKLLAQNYGLDEERAYIAGLLHDCAKCVPDADLRKIIDENLDDVSEDEYSNRKTLHAPGSYYIAKTVFGLKDEEMLSSIRWHTIGKPVMSDFEKIVFIADKIESRTRPKEYIDRIAPYLEEDNGLNKALLACYKETIKSLVRRDLKICPITVDIYNKLETEIN